MAVVTPIRRHVNPLSGRRAAPRASELEGSRNNLTASGASLAIGNAGSIQLRRERMAWQKMAWMYYRSLGLPWYVTTFKANAISRLRLFPARIEDVDQDPVPVDEPDSLQAVTVRDLAAGFSGTTIGHAAMLGMSTLQWEVPGEMYWHSTTDPKTGRNTHEILSITELEPWGTNGFQIRRLPSQVPTPVGRDDMIVRLWQPDPELQQLATSPMKAQFDVLEEMFLLTEAGVAAAKSRLASAGIMTMPDEIDYKGAEKPDGSLTSFEEEFLQVGTASIKDPRSAGRWFPIILRGKAEYLTPNYLRWFQAAAGQPAETLARLQELREIFVQDINLPTGITNVKDMTHWNAWIVDAMNWPHLQPIAVGMLTSLSRYVYQPLLVAGGMSEEEAEENVIWFDESRVVSQPDRSASATQGVTLGFIGGEAWRRSNGFEEDDQPSGEEYARMFGYRWGDPGLAGTGDWSQATGKLATRVAEQGKVGEALGPTDDTAPPGAPSPPTGPQGPNPGPPPAGPPNPGPPVPGNQLPAASKPPAPAGRPASPPVTPSQPQTVAAAGSQSDPRAARVAKLGAKLSAIDRELLTRISVLADTSIHTTVSGIGSRLRSASQGRPLVMAQIRGMDPMRVAARLGSASTHALGVDERRLIHDAAQKFAAKARPWIASGQVAAISRIAAATGQDSDYQESQTAESRSRWLDVAEGLLVAGFAKVAGEFLFDPDRTTAPTKGEVQDLVAPRSAIRGALAVAGGGGETAAGPQMGIGGGPMATDMLASGGVMVESFTWDYTDSARISFPGHLALDGIEFSSWDDPVIATQPEDSWLGDFYAPGDHDGCACGVTSRLVLAGSGDEAPEGGDGGE